MDPNNFSTTSIPDSDFQNQLSYSYPNMDMNSNFTMTDSSSFHYDKTIPQYVTTAQNEHHEQNLVSTQNEMLQQNEVFTMSIENHAKMVDTGQGFLGTSGYTDSTQILNIPQYSNKIRNSSYSDVNDYQPTTNYLYNPQETEAANQTVISNPYTGFAQYPPPITSHSYTLQTTIQDIGEIIPSVDYNTNSNLGIHGSQNSSMLLTSSQNNNQVTFADILLDPNSSNNTTFSTGSGTLSASDLEVLNSCLQISQNDQLSSTEHSVNPEILLGQPPNILYTHYDQTEVAANEDIVTSEIHEAASVSPRKPVVKDERTTLKVSSQDNKTCREKRKRFIVWDDVAALPEKMELPLPSYCDCKYIEIDTEEKIQQQSYIKHKKEIILRHVGRVVINDIELCSFVRNGTAYISHEQLSSTGIFNKASHALFASCGKSFPTFVDRLLVEEKEFMKQKGFLCQTATRTKLFSVGFVRWIVDYLNRDVNDCKQTIVYERYLGHHCSKYENLKSSQAPTPLPVPIRNYVRVKPKNKTSGSNLVTTCLVRDGKTDNFKVAEIGRLMFSDKILAAFMLDDGREIVYVNFYQVAVYAPGLILAEFYALVKEFNCRLITSPEGVKNHFKALKQKIPEAFLESEWIRLSSFVQICSYLLGKLPHKHTAKIYINQMLKSKPKEIFGQDLKISLSKITFPEIETKIMNSEDIISMAAASADIGTEFTQNSKIPQNPPQYTRIATTRSNINGNNSPSQINLQKLVVTRGPKKDSLHLPKTQSKTIISKTCAVQTDVDNDSCETVQNIGLSNIHSTSAVSTVKAPSRSKCKPVSKTDWKSIIEANSPVLKNVKNASVSDSGSTTVSNCVSRTFSNDANCVSRTFSNDANCVSKTFSNDANCVSKTFSNDAKCVSRTYSNDSDCGSNTFSNEVNCGLKTFSNNAKTFSNDTDCGPKPHLNNGSGGSKYQDAATGSDQDIGCRMKVTDAELSSAFENINSLDFLNDSFELSSSSPDKLQIDLSFSRNEASTPVSESENINNGTKEHTITSNSNVTVIANITGEEMFECVPLFSLADLVQKDEETLLNPYSPFKSTENRVPLMNQLEENDYSEDLNNQSLARSKQNCLESLEDNFGPMKKGCMNSNADLKTLNQVILGEEPSDWVLSPQKTTNTMTSLFDTPKTSPRRDRSGSKSPRLQSLYQKFNKLEREATPNTSLHFFAEIASASEDMVENNSTLSKKKSRTTFPVKLLKDVSKVSIFLNKEVGLSKAMLFKDKYMLDIRLKNEMKKCYINAENDPNLMDSFQKLLKLTVLLLSKICTISELQRNLDELKKQGSISETQTDPEELEPDEGMDVSFTELTPVPESNVEENIEKNKSNLSQNTSNTLQTIEETSWVKLCQPNNSDGASDHSGKEKVTLVSNCAINEEKTINSPQQIPVETVSSPEKNSPSKYKSRKRKLKDIFPQNEIMDLTGTHLNLDQNSSDVDIQYPNSKKSKFSSDQSEKTEIKNDAEDDSVTLIDLDYVSQNSSKNKKTDSENVKTNFEIPVKKDTKCNSEKYPTLIQSLLQACPINSKPILNTSITRNPKTFAKTKSSHKTQRTRSLQKNNSHQETRKTPSTPTVLEDNSPAVQSGKRIRKKPVKYGESMLSDTEPKSGKKGKKIMSPEEYYKKWFRSEQTDNAPKNIPENREIYAYIPPVFGSNDRIVDDSTQLIPASKFRRCGKIKDILKKRDLDQVQKETVLNIPNTLNEDRQPSYSVITANGKILPITKPDNRKVSMSSGISESEEKYEIFQSV